MKTHALIDTAKSLVANGKGLLAADESLPTIKKRFDEISLISTVETRRAYRQLLFSTPELEESISGVILHKETLDQYDANGNPLTAVLEDRGMIVGVKVDCGTTPLPMGKSGEKITEGLYGLRERLQAHRDKGARFAKWRAVFTIGEQTPSRYAIAANAHNLGCFAAFCQEQGMVPIVEPEVLMDGSHDLATCERATGQVLERVFSILQEYGILLEGMLLKQNMIVPGKHCKQGVTEAEVARATVRCLRKFVPDKVPGVVFLSGGLDPETATRYLHAINREEVPEHALSFSFGRALQQPALQRWRGRPSEVPGAQAALRQRAQCNAAAVRGFYSANLERSA